MMNATHGPVGLAAGLIAVTTWQYTVECPSPELAGWMLISATAGALLPDADHHSSSTARLWGPITRVPAAALGKLAGGHRAATHDVSKGAPLLFAVALAIGLLVPQLVDLVVSPESAPIPDYARLLARFTGMAVIALIAGLFFVGAAAFIPGKWEGRGGPNLAMSWLVAVFVSGHYPAGLPWQVVATAAAGIALGVLVGGIGPDSATISGVPAWGRDFHLLPKGFRIRTGSLAEAWLVRAPVLMLSVWLGWRLMRDGYGFFGLETPLPGTPYYWANH